VDPVDLWEAYATSLPELGVPPSPLGEDDHPLSKAADVKPQNYSNDLRWLQPPLARHIKNVAHWVVWQWVKKPDGKWTKPPFIATSPDKQSVPRLMVLEAWLREQRARLSNSSSVAKSIDYMLRRWDRFARFIEDGRVCLTNNAAERALRGFALGRKSWLFAGSERALIVPRSWQP
jgi:hypothetical protein